MGRRGRGIQRQIGRQAKDTLLCDKTKSSSGGRGGGTSPTREKEEHSGASEDSGRSFFTHIHTHSHIYLALFPGRLPLRSLDRIRDL